MHALQRLHRALVPGGFAVDTQPISARPVIMADGAPIGRLDMRAWAQTIADIDAIVDGVVAAGRFAIEQERWLEVDDGFDDAEELVTTVGGWRGTTLTSSLASRIRRADPPYTVTQEIRLRLLRALP